MLLVEDDTVKFIATYMTESVDVFNESSPYWPSIEKNDSLTDQQLDAIWMPWIEKNVPMAARQDFIDNDLMMAKYMKLVPQAAGAEQHPHMAQPTVSSTVQMPRRGGIPDHIMNMLHNGMRSGGSVHPEVVQFLGLNGRNSSLVADSVMYTAQGAYPFYHEKRAGRPTGRVMFVRDFPVEKLTRMVKI